MSKTKRIWCPDRTPGIKTLSVNDLEENDTVIVSLPESSGSGYIWMIDELSDHQGKRLDKKPVNDDTVGGATISEFKFDIEVVSGDIVLSYKRPWERKPANTKLVIRIEES